MSKTKTKKKKTSPAAIASALAPSMASEVSAELNRSRVKPPGVEVVVRDGGPGGWSGESAYSGSEAFVRMVDGTQFTVAAALRDVVDHLGGMVPGDHPVRGATIVVLLRREFSPRQTPETLDLKITKRDITGRKRKLRARWSATPPEVVRAMAEDLARQARDTLVVGRGAGKGRGKPPGR